MNHTVFFFIFAVSFLFLQLLFLFYFVSQVSMAVGQLFKVISCVTFFLAVVGVFVRINCAYMKQGKNHLVRFKAVCYVDPFDEAMNLVSCCLFLPQQNKLNKNVDETENPHDFIHMLKFCKWSQSCTRPSKMSKRENEL